MSEVIPAKMAPFQPRPTPHSREFWQNLEKGVLSIRRCTQCRHWNHPPMENCRICGGPTRFEPVTGKGVVYSFSVMHYPSVPLYEPPYIVVVVELDEQPHLRMVGRLAGVEPEDAKIGQRVVVEILDLPGGSFKVPAFWPEGNSDKEGAITL
jgi:uncharacterized OB-fold protein